MATASLASSAIVTEVYVDCVISDTYSPRTNESTCTPWLEFDHEPSDSEAIAKAQDVQYGILGRTNYRVINRDYERSSQGLWLVQVQGWDVLPTETAQRSLHIPRAQLPESYTADDLIAWGRTAGWVNLADY